MHHVQIKAEELALSKLRSQANDTCHFNTLSKLSYISLQQGLKLRAYPWDHDSALCRRLAAL